MSLIKQLLGAGITTVATTITTLSESRRRSSVTWPKLEPINTGRRAEKDARAELKAKRKAERRALKRGDK